MILIFGSEPNLKSVRELIYKRGYGKVDKQRIPLSNNAVIENVLGKYNILSVEDLIHEIISAGPNFKQVGILLCMTLNRHSIAGRPPTSYGRSSSQIQLVAGDRVNSSIMCRAVTLVTERRRLTSSSDR